jgi:hypothetical protein
MNREDKTMLALAALTYRGFGRHSEAAVDKLLRPWLPKLEQEGLGKWELVWGPATFRTPTSLFDDAMVYLARQARPPGERARYVVAIRGTNPVSVFDWVFGDLWVRLPIDWTPVVPEAAGAKISASSALGLAIIQHLAAEVPPSASGRLASIANALANAVGDFAGSLPELDPARLLKHPELLSDQLLIQRVNALSDQAGEKLRNGVFSRLLTRFGDFSRGLQDAVDRRTFDHLVTHIGSAQGRGETLLGFLNRTAVQNADLVVTGHSKGGALSVATALWLAENWAPARQAQVECFSFAGPTAGNAIFAQRYNARLGQRTRRIVNPRDIVPQAWIPENLKSVVSFYPALGPAVNLMSNAVAALDHKHVGGELIEIPSGQVPGTMVQQITHHHLDAYLQAADFESPKWTTKSIFLDD